MICYEMIKLKKKYNIKNKEEIMQRFVVLEITCLSEIICFVCGWTCIFHRLLGLFLHSLVCVCVWALECLFADIYAHMCMWRPNYSLSYHFLDAIYFVLFVCSETGFSCVALTVLELLLLNSLASNSRNLPGSAAWVLRFKAWATIPGHTPCFFETGSLPDWRSSSRLGWLA